MKRYRKLIRRTKKRNGGVRKVLVGKVTKAIFGILFRAVLFYNKLKGVLTEIRLAKFGAFELTIIPNSTGNKTTLAVVVHSVHPDIAIVLPTSSLSNRGVTIEANIVEHEVRITLRATSALAMSETRLEAVPPGEHPTRHNPKNKLLPYGTDERRNKAFPIVYATMGIIRNWHNTPTGTAAISFLRTTVKSSFVNVNPVPLITKASIIVIRFPLFVHIKRDGRYRAKSAAPNTKNGKPDVSVERILSSRFLPIFSCFLLSPDVYDIDSLLSSREEYIAVAVVSIGHGDER